LYTDLPLTAGVSRSFAQTGERYFILKDVPADLGVLHVVGRPVGNPSAVLTAVVGTPLPISQQGGMPAVTGAGNVIGNQSEPLERE